MRMDADSALVKLVRRGRMGQPLAMLALVAVLAAWPAPAPAGDAPAEPRPVVVGGDSNYPPFHYLDPGGQPSGFDVAMARSLLDAQGIPVRFELGDWDDALARLERGDVDMVPMFVSGERRGRFLFSKPYMLRYHAVYGRMGTPAVGSLDELAGHAVAVQRGGLARDVLAAMPGMAGHLVEVTFEPEAMDVVAEGRAQYALVPTWIGREALKRKGLESMVALSPPLLEREYAFAISRARPELVRIVDAGLDRLRTSGRQQQLFETSIQDMRAPPSRIRIAVLLVLAVVGVIAIVVVVATWWQARSREARAARERIGNAPLLATELRDAIATGTLGYALQPKLDLHTRQWAGAELLVRWVHPVHGPLAPSAFLPLAERERVIGDMTLYLLRHAATHCSEWRELGHGLTVSVNISANNLGDRTLLDALVAAAGVAAPSLLLEVTETDAMDDPAMIAKAVVKLRRRGIRISIDDFGTGHSSLTKLRLLKADEVKIDRSFVAGLVQSPSDQAIVLSTIQLAHAVGAHVTAEGIEDDATLEWLAQAGCDYGQGFGLARPMAPEEFARLLAERRA
jgi:EAL domain-containing protein (putative c-di-GMP-specific phosphodiesterase class I)/ABC-type amino acid transport substrate-binding protein